MQAARFLRKLCLVVALVPLAAHAGDLKVSIRVPWLVPSLLAALFPPPPASPSPHHLGIAPRQRSLSLEAGVAIDARTFVADGIHYRVADVEPLPPGSPEEARARAGLQALLDAGAVMVRVENIEPSGIRIVALQPNG